MGITIGGGNTDIDSIHKNLPNEISAIPSKALPSGTDLLLIEDSGAGNAKKKILISSLPGVSTEFSDSTFRVLSSGDVTKELELNVSNVTSGNTRTLTVPNYNGTILAAPSSSMQWVNTESRLIVGTELTSRSEAKLSSLSSNTNTGSESGYFSSIMTLTSNGNSFSKGITASAAVIVPTGVTNTGSSGYAVAGGFSAYRSLGSDAGHLDRIVGIQVSTGGFNFEACDTDEAIGIEISSIYLSGTFGNTAELKIVNPLMGATVTGTASAIVSEHVGPSKLTGALALGTQTDPDALLQVEGTLSLGALVELTISSGAVTITKAFHSIDTESDAATDDLGTINGGFPGMILIISAQNDSRTVVVKDGTGNLSLSGDFTMDHSGDTLMLVKTSGNWREISRSDNSA